MTWCMARGLHEPQGPVVEQIEITIKLEYVQLADVAIVVLAVHWSRPCVRPHGITDLVALNDMHCIREITHAAGMIEMQMGIDDVAHVVRSESKPLELFVYHMLAREVLRTERGAQTRTPVCVAALRVRDGLVDAGVPQDQPVLGVLNNHRRRRYVDVARREGDEQILGATDGTDVHRTHFQAGHVSSLNFLD